jgi:hypothetical protein
MASSPAIGPRRIALEEVWQLRVNEARRNYEKQPTLVTRAKLQRALYFLGELLLRGKLPPETE